MTKDMDQQLANQQEPTDSLIYSVLNAVRLEGGLIALGDIPNLRRHIVRRENLMPDSSFVSSARACLANGWIKILTSEDCLMDRQYWEPQRYVTWGSFNEYRPGGVDFTPSGWAAFAQLSQTLRGIQWDHEYMHIAEHMFSEPECLSIVSGTEESILQHLQATLDGSHGSEPQEWMQQRIPLEFIGPYPIAHWWPARFIELPKAYRLDVRGANLMREEGN